MSFGMILPGDVLVRNGTIMGMPLLGALISQPYTHVGVALSQHQAHDVGKNWYQTVSMKEFFCDEAKTGLFIVFLGLGIKK